MIHGSHVSWKVAIFFSLKFPGPGKSRRVRLVPESHGNTSLRSWKVLEFNSGSD